MSGGKGVALPSSAGGEDTIEGYLRRLTPEIQKALPRGMDAERVGRLALTSVRQSVMQATRAGHPERSLAACSPESFAGSLLTAAALGLEPGVGGEAYLVPYRRECTLIVGYQGYAKLFWQNPIARHLDCQPVYEADEFDFAKGTSPFLTHRPNKRAEQRGDVIYYYAVAGIGQHGSSFEVLTPAEVRELRGGKVGSSGDIADPQRWMERKTVLRQLVKTLPRSTMLNAALVVDEQGGSTLHAQQVAQSINAGDTPELETPEAEPTTEPQQPAGPDMADPSDPDDPWSKGGRS